MNRNQKINLTDLLDDAVSNAIARRHQVLNAEESKGVIGGQIDRQTLGIWIDDKHLFIRKP